MQVTWTYITFTVSSPPTGLLSAEVVLNKPLLTLNFQRHSLSCNCDRLGSRRLNYTNVSTDCSMSSSVCYCCYICCEPVTDVVFMLLETLACWRYQWHWWVFWDGSVGAGVFVLCDATLNDRLECSSSQHVTSNQLSHSTALSLAISWTIKNTPKLVGDFPWLSRCLNLP